MTRNQIEFNKLRETERANRAQEALTQLRDTRAHEVALRGATETERSNRAKEGISQATLDESKRANIAREVELNRSNVAKEKETARHNLAGEVIDTAKTAETVRHQLASEADASARTAEMVLDNALRRTETTRHNMAMEAKNFGGSNTTVNVRTEQPTEVPLKPDIWYPMGATPDKPPGKRDGGVGSGRFHDNGFGGTRK